MLSSVGGILDVGPRYRYVWEETVFNLRQKIEKSCCSPRHLQRGNIGPLKAELNRQLKALKAVNAGLKASTRGGRAGGSSDAKK